MLGKFKDHCCGRNPCLEQGKSVRSGRDSVITHHSPHSPPPWATAGGEVKWKIKLGPGRREWWVECVLKVWFNFLVILL